MTRAFFLNWAIMAVSLFNTILLLWLGLTVLLNAEQHFHCRIGSSATISLTMCTHFVSILTSLSVLDCG